MVDIENEKIELKRTLAAKLEGEPLFVLPPGGRIWKEGENS